MHQALGTPDRDYSTCAGKTAIHRNDMSEDNRRTPAPVGRGVSEASDVVLA